jgi:hypothetical protein
MRLTLLITLVGFRIRDYDLGLGFMVKVRV